jgi:peptidyl-prolyl cis-trans isomerase D
MPKKQRQIYPTKKHLARMERERIQTRYILFGSLFVLLIVIGLIGYGILDQNYLQRIRPVAVVNGEKISTKDFQSLVRYNRQELIQSAMNTYQLKDMFGNDPQASLYIGNQLSQIRDQLVPTVIGEQTLNQLVYDALIRQEAARRGIIVSTEDIQKAVQNGFEYYPQGTPTATPTWNPPATSTLSPTQYALVSPTPTVTATAVPTITATMAVTVTSTPTQIPSVTPTSEPTLTPTPYTLDGFNTQYNNIVKRFKDSINFTEQDFRKLFEMQVYRDKVKNAILADLNLSRIQEQIWVRHILVKDEQTAKDLLARLKNGEDWTKLAAEFSIDTSNKDMGGDLGWFGRGKMVTEFENGAFKLSVGQISDPVQTQYGWHLIQVLGRENRELSDAEFSQLQDQNFSNWLTSSKSKATIKIDDTWKDRVPAEPILPTEVSNYIDALLQQQIPQVIPTQPVPAPSTP